MSSANLKNPQAKKATSVKGTLIPFDAATNPYNFEGHLTVDWHRQIEYEAKAIKFKQFRKATMQEIQDNPFLS